MMFKQRAMMAEVTRLTRAGELGKAMAMLQGQGQAGATDVVSEPTGNGPAPQTIGSNAAQMPVLEGLRGLAGGLDRLGANPFQKGKSAFLARDMPSPLPDGALFERHSFSNRSGSRAYRLYTPSRRSGERLPLVVMLHGCKQSPEDFAAGTRMNELAEDLGLFVAYPEQTSAANQSRCWNWFVPGDQGRDSGEPSLIAGITRQVMQDVAVDPSRVYIAGLSAGGAAAAIMASAYPDLYAAACIHSGLACGAARDMPSAFSAMQAGGAVPVGLPDHPRRTIVFHGDRDHTVNIVNSDQVIAQSMGSADLQDAVTQGQSVGGIAYTRTVHADVAGRPTLELWVLHGFGHAWSGGSGAGSFTDPRGPDASREMMRFFLEE